MYFVHCRIEIKECGKYFKANLLFSAKPSNSALGHTLGQVARVLDWAYPSNPFRWKAKRLTMVVVVGGCVVFQTTTKYVLFLRRNSTEQ